MNLAKGTETLTDFTLVSQTLAEGKLSVTDVNQSVNKMNNESCKTVKKKKQQMQQMQLFQEEFRWNLEDKDDTMVDK